MPGSHPRRPHPGRRIVANNLSDHEPVVGRTGIRCSRWVPMVAAALMAASAFVVSGIVRNTYPFGPVSRNTNDLGQQFIPFHAHLRDILTGQAPGDLLINWNSGFGVPFLGDFMAYMGASLSWIVLLFPRDKPDLALFVIATTAIAVAAGAMTAFLRRLRPSGPVWLAIVAGVSYGTCGWAIDDAAYMTEWLNGLIAFPVICLLCEWILRRRSIPSMVVSPLVVALCWMSHFYTVYMATIGAGIIVLARVLSYDKTVSAGHRVSGAFRCMVAVGGGIGLSMPLLLPTFWSVRYSTPSPDVHFEPINWLDFLSRLLSGSERVGLTPGLAVGTVMLLLALSFPFNGKVAARERIVYTLAVALTILSMQIAFTHEVWHGFDSPNGSPFRQAFVVAGMLVILGWMSIAAGLRSFVAVLAPLVVLGGLYVVTWDRFPVTQTTHVMVPIVAAVAAVAWLLTRSTGASVWVRRVAVVLVVGVVMVDVTSSAVAIDKSRSKFLAASGTWGERNDKIRALVESADDWPNSRVAPGALATVNDPMLLGGQGPQYYTSTIPWELSNMLIGLGFGYSSYGRAPIDPQNPVIDAAFGISARVVADKAREGEPQLEKYFAAPLVTARPGAPWKSSDPGPFGAQENIIGADVYEVPRAKPKPAAGVQVSSRRTGELVLVPESDTARPSEVQLTATCHPGSEIYLWAPKFVGEVRANDAKWTSILKPTAKRPGIYTGAPLQRIGTTDANGVADVTLRISGQARLPAAPIGCLDRTALKSAVDKLNQSKPAAVHFGGHSIDINLAPGPARTVVIAVGRTPGWQCSVDGAKAGKPKSLSGMMTVAADADAKEVACFYRPVGGKLGLALGFVAVLALAFMIGLFELLRSRRPGGSDNGRALPVDGRP